jgi:hypothetical protein
LLLIAPFLVPCSFLVDIAILLVVLCFYLIDTTVPLVAPCSSLIDIVVPCFSLVDAIALPCSMYSMLLFLLLLPALRCCFFCYSLLNVLDIAVPFVVLWSSFVNAATFFCYSLPFLGQHCCSSCYSLLDIVAPFTVICSMILFLA